MHVSREDLDRLFGPGYELTVDRPLYQPGNFAAKETVTLIGPRSRLISNLRILGPLRSRSQIELAFTDAVSLGLRRRADPPLRQPRRHAGRPRDGAARASSSSSRASSAPRCTSHMSPADAAHYGVKQGDLMKLRVGGDAAVTFERVHVRIDPSSRLDVHMDTDEANACGLAHAREIELFK